MLLSTLYCTLQQYTTTTTTTAQNVHDAKAKKLYCNYHLDHNSFIEKNMQSYQSNIRAQLSVAVASVSAIRYHWCWKLVSHQLNVSLSSIGILLQNQISSCPTQGTIGSTLSRSPKILTNQLTVNGSPSRPLPPIRNVLIQLHFKAGTHNLWFWEVFFDPLQIYPYIPQPKPIVTSLQHTQS